MKQIGILGGTFNPVHIGHLAAAQTVMDALKLDRILFVPSFFPPHKSRRDVIAAKHRLAMVRLAIKDNPGFDASDAEIRRQGKSYSIDTLLELKRLFPGKTKFYFIVGSDMLAGLKNWRRIDALARLVTFAVVDRKGYANIKTPYRIRHVGMLDLGLSSSYIRQQLKSGRSVKYLLPEKVELYIKKKRLYR
jgi:nicotinate-nucleotide adenylyltransferase